jgi:hypothetical protein
MVDDDYSELRIALADYMEESAKTAKWINEEYRPKFEASTLPGKVWLDGVVFRPEYHDAHFKFQLACRPEVIVSLLADLDRKVDQGVSTNTLEAILWCTEDRGGMVSHPTMVNVEELRRAVLSRIKGKVG